MKRQIRSGRTGSVIVMVTVAALLLFGIVGIVVDIGLAYYYRRAAQASADAAAQAGAKNAYEQGLAKGNFTSIDGAQVQAAAIKYGTLNGFTDGGDNSRQTVVITSGTDKSGLPGDLNNLNIYYWVQAQVKTKVNSLFITAAGGGDKLESGAVAIAAVLQAPLLGSVYVLDRACEPLAGGAFDCSTAKQDNAGLGKGVDVFRSGNGSITVDGGVFINSSANNNGPSGNPPGPVSKNYALEQNGSPNNLPIVAPLIQFAWDGNYKGAPDPKSGLTYTNGPQVPDPTYSMNVNGKQPTVKTVTDLVTSSTPIYGVVGNALSGTFGPGVYVGINPPIVGNPITFTGAPILLNGVTFTGTSSTNNTFIFLGGMKVTDATFAPGIYVAGGVTGNNFALDLGKATAKDGGGGQFGEMFLLTKPDYQPTASATKLLDLAPTNGQFPIQPIATTGTAIGALRQGDFTTVATWGFGSTNLKSGQGNADINLTGLKGRAACDAGACPAGDAELYLYQPALLWQDRRNCVGVIPIPGYTPGPGCQGTTDSVKITADASSFGGLNGMIYQPRGALFDLSGNGTKQDATKLITGAISLSGGPNITLTPNPTSTNQIIVSLIR
jgi:hypothetical protein